MDLTKIKINERIKNYKEFCNLICDKVKTGNSKKIQLEEWKRYFDYEKEGVGFIVKEIYDFPKEKNDKRKFGNNLKDYDNFLIPNKYMKHSGIYKITHKNNIYIGSTTAGFRKRFIEHYNSNEISEPHNMLHKGGTFTMLYDMSIIDDEPLIRMVEEEFIKYFTNCTEWNVVNKRNKTYSIKEKGTNKIKYKIIKIKVKEDEYLNTLQLLAKQNLININDFLEGSDNE